ncbi:MAG: prepilin peptidase [Bryobacterales bacterium]|nr:prepilin peptidase [Bryobacterales bacterium]MDE0263267.1 prepilin peptidase [Bryobacterales bacterium]MDE0622295.1 prepilin peptidase [Bryobacterales bacterium]
MTALAFVLGLLVGSFLNVCIHRWPRAQSVVAPRSRCPACNRQIAWHDNIPVLSYILLRGRCGGCGTAISPRYLVVELATAGLFALIVIEFGAGLVAIKVALLAAMLTILFFTDLEHFVLPDQVTLSGLLAGVAFSPFVPLRAGVAQVGGDVLGLYPAPWAVSLLESLASALIFGGILYLTGEIFYRLRGVEGLGFGDVKLVAMLAAFQGSSEALLVLLAACLLATLYGTAAVLSGRQQWRSPLPLGSYLAFAGIAAIFFADDILNRYWDLVLE